MRREDQTKTWLLSGLVLAAGVGLLYGAGCHPKVQKGSKVLLVGDSLAVGLGTHIKGLCTDIGAGYVGLSKVSTRMDQWLKEPGYSGPLKEQLTTFRPDLVIVSLGTNDSATKYTDDVLEATARGLADLLKSTGADVLWVLPPPLPFPDRVSAIVRKLGVATFDSSDLSIPRGPDGLHPTASGYAGWAAVIWQTLTCS